MIDSAHAEQLRRLRERLAASSRRLAREARGRRLYETISKLGQLRPLLQVLGAEILALGDFDAYLFNLVDETESNLICEAIHLPPHCKSVEATYLGFKFPFHLLDANVEACKKRRSVYVNAVQVKKYPGTTLDRFSRWSMEQMLVLPLVNGKRVFGTVMTFTSGRPMAVGAEGRLRNLLAPFSQQIAHAYAYERLRRREQELAAASDSHQALLRLLERLGQLEEEAQIYQLTSDYLLEHFGFDCVAVLMETGRRIDLIELAVRDPALRPMQEAVLELYRDNGYPLDQAEGATPLVFMQNTPLYFPDVQEIMHLPMGSRDRRGLEIMATARTFFLLPVRGRRATLGVLWLASLGRVVHLSQAQREQILTLTSLLGNALSALALSRECERQRRQLRLLSRRDALTGLGNPAALREELERRAEEYRRDPKAQLSLALIDLDHFRHFNEIYGAALADGVLEQAAERLRRLVRRMDVPCRYEGGKFALILPRCGPEGCRRLAERLRTGIGGRPFETAQGPVQVTVSIGAACYRPGEAVEAFIGRAAEAAGEALRAGRNRVVLAGECARE